MRIFCSRWVYLWLIFMYLLVSACDALPSSDSSPNSIVAATQNTPVHQTSPTPKNYSVHPTPTTTSNMGHVRAYLGSDISAFRTLYGQNGDTSLKGTIIWTLSHTEWFTLTFDTSNNHVYDLDHYFYPATQPDNHQQNNVSFDVARNTCIRFMPPDSKLISTNNNKPDPSLTDGIQYIYKSAWLARRLDASWFYFDEGAGTMNSKLNTPVDPGIFTLFYIGNEQTGYEMCFLTTGINWPF